MFPWKRRDSRARLVAVLKEAAELLRSYGVEHWSERLEGHAEQVRLADSKAVPELLADFGGMGSFNDVWIDPRNGHRITTDQVEPVNKRFHKLQTEIYQLARSLPPRL
jgi:hypothetical protein